MRQKWNISTSEQTKYNKSACLFNSSSQKSSMTVWLPRLARSSQQRLESRCVGEAEVFLWPSAGISSSSCRASQGTLPLCQWSRTLKSSKASIWPCSTRWGHVHVESSRGCFSACLGGKNNTFSDFNSDLLWPHQGLKPQSFRNPYDIPRSHLLDQLSRMRRNLLNTSVCNLRGQDSGRSTCPFLVCERAAMPGSLTLTARLSPQRFPDGGLFLG